MFFLINIFIYFFFTGNKGKQLTKERERKKIFDNKKIFNKENKKIIYFKIRFFSLSLNCYFMFRTLIFFFFC